MSSVFRCQSGELLEVSASWSLAEQIDEVARWLDQLENAKSVRDSILDIGFDSRLGPRVAVQGESIPVSFMHRLVALNVELCLSLYPEFGLERYCNPFPRRASAENQCMDALLSGCSQVILEVAGKEASRLCHEYIGTEHLLLGIVSESNGAAAGMLQSFGITLDRVRSSVESIVGIGPPTAPPDDLPFTPRAKRAISFACEEAAQRDNPRVDPEHLLHGILREGQGVAVQVFSDLQVPPENIREQVSQLLDRGDAGRPRIG